MVHSNEDPRKAKISPEFKVRLLRLGPQQKVRAIVMLHTKDAGEASAGRQSPAERQVAIEAMHKSAELALIEIDGILERYDGKRLAPSVNALGSVPVEATATGIIALAASDHVKVILEDQPLSLFSKLRCK